MKKILPWIMIFLAACASSTTSPLPPSSSSSASRTSAPSSAPASSSAASSSRPTTTPVVVAVPATATPAHSGISVTNLQQAKQPDGSVRTTAQVKALDNLGIGQMEVSSPDTMVLGESRTIRLAISPSTQLAALTPVAAPAKTPDLPQFVYKYSGNIQIYSVMNAELRALGFNIDRTGPQRRDVKPGTATTWDWIVSARSTGRQDLSIEITIPVIIDGTFSDISTSWLQNVPMVIQVSNPPPTATLLPTPAPSLGERIGESMLNNSGAIIVALIGLLGTLIGILVKVRSDAPKEKK